MSRPKLRFNEFFEEWETKKLETLVEFHKGKNISKGDIVADGLTECIRYGELYTAYTEVISNINSRTSVKSSELFFSKKNDVIIPSSGETSIDIATASCVLKDNVALGGDLNVLRTKQNGIFLSYYLNNQKKHDIARLAQGNSVVHLYNSQLKTLNVTLPNKTEQEKIATFFSTIDQKLNLLKEKKEKLERYKKGVMQQIFSQKLRFKNTSTSLSASSGNDFPAWEEKKLEDCLDYLQPTKFLVSSTEYNDAYKTPVLTAGKTFILGYTNETDGIFDDNLPVIIFDDFTTASKFVDFPFKAKSSAMKILIAKKDFDIRFMYEAMQNMRYEIGGHERHWISKFAPYQILIPSLPEQQKIADFLSTLDAKINLLETQIRKTEIWKKGLLQQMFV